MVSEWGCWFLQNQHSNYLRVSGFTRNLFLLPIFCSIKIIILEYTRQIVGLQALLTLKHKTRVTFPISLEYYTYQNNRATKEVELQNLSLKEFDYARDRYDPMGKLKQMMFVSYPGHQPILEDFWENFQDSFEARERRYYRLIVSWIRNFNIETNIPKDLRDEGELLDPVFKETGINKRLLTPI